MGNDKSFLLAPFPQLARAVSSRGALKLGKPSARRGETDKKFLFASFPQLARAVLSRGALKGELLVRVRNMGRISSRSTSF